MAEHMRFGSLDIAFDASCLRPRPWTQAQSVWAAELLVDAPEGALLELCTGAGQIGLLAVAESSRCLVAVDVEAGALEFARANAEAAGLTDRVEWRCAELESALAEGELFPVALADPPWVTSDGVGDLPEDPEGAIDGGDDGLDIARRCVEVLARHLQPGGVAVIQLGSPQQAETLGAWSTERDLLVPGEVRRFDGGVLLRLDRPAA